MPRQDKEQVNEGTSGQSLTSGKLPTKMIVNEIAACLPEKDQAMLSGLSTALFFASRAPLAKKLLSHVIRGEEKEALEMIHNNPRLLLVTSEGTDYSGRPYTGFTAFQAALLCHDVTLWKKIEPYFDELPDGQQEKVRQFKWLFPEGLPKQRPYDFTSLIQVMSESADADIRTALRKEKNDTLICQALKNFRTAFTDLAMNEAFFNPLHLMKALDVFYAQYTDWGSDRIILFWRQIIGYTQRFLPASYSQAFCQGFFGIVHYKDSLERTLNFRHCPGSYYPLSESSGLVFDFGIYGVSRGLGGAGCVPCDSHWGGPSGDDVRLDLRDLRDYVKQIQQSYLDLSTTCGATVNPSPAATI